MNALYAFLLWILGMFGGYNDSPERLTQVKSQDRITNQNTSRVDPLGPQIINVNPRTVLALEDTHFRPDN